MFFDVAEEHHVDDYVMAYVGLSFWMTLPGHRQFIVWFFAEGCSSRDTPRISQLRDFAVSSSSFACPSQYIQQLVVLFIDLFAQRSQFSVFQRPLLGNTSLALLRLTDWTTPACAMSSPRFGSTRRSCRLFRRHFNAGVLNVRL